MKRIGKIAGFVFAALLVAVLIFYFFCVRPPPDAVVERLPVPNGYTYLVQAADGICGSIPDESTATAESLRPFVSSNQVVFLTVSNGLAMQCRVPVDPHMYENKFWHFKQLALAMVAMGRLEELENHTNNAAEVYLSVVRLGHEMERGGPLMHHLIARTIQKIGYRNLRRILPALPPAQCGVIKSQLEQMEQAAESLENIAKSENQFMRKSLNSVPFFTAFRAQISFMISMKSIVPQRKLIQEAAMGDAKVRAEVRQLIDSAAERAGVESLPSVHSLVKTN